MDLDWDSYPCMAVNRVPPGQLTEEDKRRLAAVAMVQKAFEYGREKIPTNSELEDAINTGMEVVRQLRQERQQRAEAADREAQELYMPV